MMWKRKWTPFEVCVRDLGQTGPELACAEQGGGEAEEVGHVLQREGGRVLCVCAMRVLCVCSVHGTQEALSARNGKREALSFLSESHPLIFSLDN